MVTDGRIARRSDLQTFAKTNFDVVPEFQVTLSRRQHVRANMELRIPANNTAGRSTQLMFYLLWDWQDGTDGFRRAGEKSIPLLLRENF